MGLPGLNQYYARINVMANGSLMKVKVLLNAPLGAFCNTFDLHLAIIGLFESGRFTQVLLSLSYLRAVKAQTSLCICTVSSEPLLLTKNGS